MSDVTAEERLVAVQKQAEGVQAQEDIATASNHTALGVGFGLSLFESAAAGNPVALIAFGAGLGSFEIGSWLAEKTHAADHVADGLEALGLNRIGRPGPDGS